MGLPDIDSDPDVLNNNDPGGQPDSPADDYVNGNGNGTVGDGVAATDEDDHDGELILAGTFFDLALRKTLTTPGPYIPGQLVTFTIEVINQGTVTATNIEVIDYLVVPFLQLQDANWTQSVNSQGLSVATLNTPIPTLAPGASTIRTITFRIDPNSPGGSGANFAEILSADNAMGLSDIDSSPDELIGNDGGSVPNGATDNYVDGNGTGFFGTDNPLTDEDDQDPAQISFGNVFDLALTKSEDKFSGLNNPPYEPGETVYFNLFVLNPGTVEGMNIQVTDYIPTGLILVDPNWTETSPGKATLNTPIASLAPGAFTVVSIAFQIDNNFQGDQIVNYAEISSASNALGLNDIDSRPDNDNTNDGGGQPNSSADNAYAGSGTGVPGDGVAATDEDDHDPALVAVQQTFDLALRKTLAGAGPFVPGGAVTFNIEITNQGTLDATNVQISDYIPTGLTLNDASWTASGGIATLNTSIASIPKGATVTRTITFQIQSGFEGTSIINYAEISGASNALGLADIDSDPDNISNNDAGGLPGSATDNTITGDGTGAPGDGVAATDEDDHDPAQVTVTQIFDLALRKTPSATTPGPFVPGSAVTFNIEIFNQGTLTATNIQVTDYIPTGLILNDPIWTQSGATATLVDPIASLAPGASTIVAITFNVDVNFMQTSIRNWAEISSASNALGLQDIDSTPDGTNFNQPGETDDLNDNNIVNQDGKNGGDEDDHDPSELTIVQTFDLALRKTLNVSTPVPFYPGSTVTFTIEIINQGTLDATNVQVNDYIPTGLTLADANWTASGGRATLNTPIASLPARTSTTRSITYTINSNFTGTQIINIAEIASAQNALNQSDKDSNPDNTSNNDADGRAGSAADNAVDGNGTGTPGGINPATDEDDQDPALINVTQIFDLALRKTLSTSTPGPFAQGSTVTFNIEVINQGTLPATTIGVSDYIPTGLTLNDGNWTAVGNIARLNTAIPSLAPGASMTLSITFTIDANFQGTSIRNWTEITGATNVLGLQDIDSTPDEMNFNTPGELDQLANDNVVDQNGNHGGDEDDHDPAEIAVQQTFDLALRKTLSPTTQQPFDPGDPVTFVITVFNQGTVDAADIQISDYIPNGLTLNDANWTETSPGVAMLNTRIASLAAGQSTTRTITFTLDPGFVGSSLTNYAEISEAGDPHVYIDIDSEPDSLNTNDAGGQPDSPADDYVDGNGTGTPGDGVAATDEDDHDSETILAGTFFDLALRKTLTSVGPFSPGDLVTFTIEVINQGTITATDIELVDYITTTNLILMDPDWTAGISSQGLDIATLNTPIAFLAPGASTTVDITFQLDPMAVGGSAFNFAEILDADNAMGLSDIDSSPDDVINDDGGSVPTGATDNYVDGDGTGAFGVDNPFTDEDDQDPAVVSFGDVFDLSLIKYPDNTGLNSPPYVPGETVYFTILVGNLGTVDASDIQVSDYIPSGMTLVDANWTETSPGIATLNTPIASLPAGSFTSLTIALQINNNFQGGQLINYAEISSAIDVETGLPGMDIDSQFDQDNTNDAGGQPDSAADDYFNGDATGMIGDGVAATDEDDHDPALIEVQQAFDLALRKTVSGAGPFVSGGTVTFNIEVFNQGTLDATNVQISDYIPSGLTLNDGNWTATGGIATLITPIPNLASGASTIVPITFTIDNNFEGTNLVNFAEISAASNALSLPDIDSKPDNINTNDAGGHVNSATDDVITGDGTGVPGDVNAATDEDDHDPAPVTITQTFDLALRKTLSPATPGPFLPGVLVTFTIEVVNQGTLTANDVQISDYIPAGLVLNDEDWIETAGVATLADPIPLLAPGASTTVDITFSVEVGFQGTTIRNWAEISGGTNLLGYPDIDSDPNGTNFNEPGETDDLNDNDVVNQDGKNGGDEDDHDPAEINIDHTFDLALRKTLNAAPDVVFKPGDDVTFTIKVLNQGTLDATDIQISDYIPTGMTLNDANWTAAGGIATLNTPIAALMNRDSTIVTITFTINNNFQGTSLRNWAEISSATNALSQPDIDSDADGTNFNQDEETDDLDDDDVVNEDGKNGGDEDDHDPAEVPVSQTFDLALRKTLTSAGPFMQGSTVTFTIEVINQGTLDATNVQVTDYIPGGFTLADVNWTASGATATLNTPIASLAAGASTTRTISFTINPTFQGTSIRNWAEISSATNALGQPDVDSDTDGINFNETGETDDLIDDNVVDQDGKTGGDEDDHDPAEIPVVQIFDLALRKTLASAGPFNLGGTVVFMLEVLNQGTLDATNIQISDYIPTGLTLNDSKWTAAGGVATLKAPISFLAAGASTVVSIQFTIDANFQGTSIRNWAEISSATNVLGQADIDSDPDGMNFNEPGETNDLNDDNVVNQDGKNGGDEDDHDPAEFTVQQTFDLALVKILSATTPGPFAPGSSVTFTISVINQGTLDATNVNVVDYIPFGLVLADTDWTEYTPGAAQLNVPIASLPKGVSTSVDISFTIDNNFMGASLLNFAEIRSATNALGLPDVDSQPDALDNNDGGGAPGYSSDNATTGDGTGQPGDQLAETDEDDHDPALIQVGQSFDLALRKYLNLGATPGSF
ncbi:MAG: DUF11 domain-containing protein [Saprospiraceae bacterium]|nr:DUF11 domain-containing protein [Saprospiraceae bacterium]